MCKLRKIRKIRFEQQGGRCHYCGLPMWQDDAAFFAQVHGLSRKRARWLQASAEHLVARCDGGPDKLENIAAACIWCNKRRHSVKKVKAPEAYQKWVQRLMAQGKWHPASGASGLTATTAPR